MSGNDDLIPTEIPSEIRERIDRQIISVANILRFAADFNMSDNERVRLLCERLFISSDIPYEYRVQGLLDTLWPLLIDGCKYQYDAIAILKYLEEYHEALYMTEDDLKFIKQTFIAAALQGSNFEDNRQFNFNAAELLTKSLQLLNDKDKDVGDLYENYFVALDSILTPNMDKAALQAHLETFINFIDKSNGIDLNVYIDQAITLLALAAVELDATYKSIVCALTLICLQAICINPPSTLNLNVNQQQSLIYLSLQSFNYLLSAIPDNTNHSGYSEMASALETVSRIYPEFYETLINTIRELNSKDPQSNAFIFTHEMFGHDLEFMNNYNAGILSALFIRKMRDAACDTLNISFLSDFFYSLKEHDPNKAIEFLLDPPSFRTLRILLGHLSEAPSFETNLLWLEIQELFNSELNSDFFNKFTAEAIVGWGAGQPVNFAVMNAAAKLFRLEDKIKANARDDEKFNPLLLALQRQTNPDVDTAIVVHYIKHYTDYEYITNPRRASDKLFILEYLIIHCDHYSKVEHYHEYVNSLISEDVLEKIDAAWIKDIAIELRDRYQNLEIPDVFVKIVFALGFVPSDTIFSYDSLMDYLIKNENAVNGTIESLLAGEVQIGLLVPQHKVKSGKQSAHDDTLAKIFDDFAYAIDLSASIDDQIMQIRFFTLFELYRTNPNAKIFNELFKIARVKNLFENNKQFPGFLKKVSVMSDDQLTGSGLLYVLKGITTGIRNSKLNALDAGIKEQQEDTFAQQAILSLRALRGNGDAEATSYFLIDELVRVGTLGLINYINSPMTELGTAITSHDDIVEILYRLPRDSEEDIDNESGERSLLINLYIENKDRPFEYQQYKDVLVKIWEKRMAHNRENICTYIASAATAYSDNLQSCVTGCKARMSTLLLGDMFFGPKRSRLEDIQDCLYRAMLSQLKNKVAAATTMEEKREILGSFLSARVSNAALYAAGKSQQMLSTYDSGALRIRSLEELFDVKDLDAIFMKIKREFNNSDDYNINRNHNLDADELEALRVMLRIGGGETVMRKLDTFFRPTYGPKSVDLNEIENIVLHINGLVEATQAPTTLVAAQERIKKMKIKNIAFKIMQMQQGKDFDPHGDHVITEESPEYKTVIELLALAKQDRQQLHTAVTKLAVESRHRPPSPTQFKNI